MKIDTKTLLFLFILAAPFISCGQTSVGIKGGINWGSVRDAKDASHYEGTYKLYPSYCFGLDVKHRLVTNLRLGGSVEYYMNDIQWYDNYGGHNYTSGEDIRYKIGYMRFTVLPEFVVGRQFQFYCNAGPYLSLMVNSSKDGQIWDHAYPGHYIDITVTGTAGDYLKTVDAGVKGCIGMGLTIIQNLVISIEYNANLGLVNVRESGYGDVKTWGVSVFAGIVYEFPYKKK